MTTRSVKYTKSKLTPSFSRRCFFLDTKRREQVQQEEAQQRTSRQQAQPTVNNVEQLW